MVYHEEVTQKYIPGCLKKKWFLRLGIKNIPSMSNNGTRMIPHIIYFLESRARDFKDLMARWLKKSIIK